MPHLFDLCGESREKRLYFALNTVYYILRGQYFTLPNPVYYILRGQYFTLPNRRTFVVASHKLFT